MSNAIAYITLILAAWAALAASAGLLFVWHRRATTGERAQEVSALLRTESDRQRATIEDQSRLLRQELTNSVRGLQDSLLDRLDAGVRTIDDKVAGIGRKLDEDIRAMAEEATKNRDSLRQTIEAKLDDAAVKQATASSELRQEVTGTINLLQETLIRSAGDQRSAQAEQFEAFARRLSESLAESDRRAEEMKSTLKESLDTLALASETRHLAVLSTLVGKHKELAEANLTAATAMREELASSFQQLSVAARESLEATSSHQKERLESVGLLLTQMSEKHEKTQEALRQTVEGRLDTLRNENTAKLEEIRKTVDEQLQATLNERITSSFKLVHDQLEQVYRGLGEMQKLADGVGDLKRVLTNVKTRGIFGEVQLGSLIEQMFSPDQYLENAQVRENSQERVEFAVKLPGRSGEGDVLIPIDAKFPIDDYERILQAVERADVVGIEEAAVQLEGRIALFAKDIGTKYVNPPTTTDFAILFLPTEGLYAEVLRRRGLTEVLFEKHHVVICGPTNLLAMLNAFRMSIRAVAIQQRSTEVWRILGGVRSEFDKHGVVIGKLQRQLEASLNTVDALGTRTRAMKRKLQDVESIGADKIEEVLGLPAPTDDGDGDMAESA